MSSSASDIEAGAAHVPLGEKAAGAADASPTAVAHRAKRQEAAALLALWSALVLTEGTVRFVLAAPAGDLFPADRPASVAPPFLPFLASLMECVFGLTGVLVGVGGAFFNLHNRAVTVAFLISQTVMSWFVFIVYVFLLPSYRAHFLTAPIMQFDSVGASRAFITMGILTSAAICLALQGGQFTFGMRLLVHQGEPGKASRTAGAEGRGLFWNGNMVFAGLSTAVAGILLLANGAGAGRVATGIFGAPPHVGVFPLHDAPHGAVNGRHGGGGGGGDGRVGAAAPFLAVSVANYLLMYCNFTVVQVGAIRPTGPPHGHAAFHSGLVLLTALTWALLCSGGAKGAGRGGSVAH
eukprot:TRINITY_DN2994_c0_g1_i2.p1 TRINITY_DN2994_c0_g1~~TRINITY_DN2994_c0_g1_i2.p1  ORF type:complete len:408 (-),score=113.91 TRINITY_DN2994_c0_g1_i2:96-1148(-)